MQSLPLSKDSVLLIIDVQERLAAAMPSEYIDPVFTRIGKLATAAQALEIPIIVTEQYAQGLGPTLPTIQAPIENYNPMDKAEFSCYRNEAIQKKLSDLGKKDVIVCGLETHICVLQTALDAHQHGSHAWVIEDATICRNTRDFHSGLSTLRASDAQVITFETLLYGWLESADHPQFKALSGLTKQTDY